LGHADCTQHPGGNRVPRRGTGPPSSHGCGHACLPGQERGAQLRPQRSAYMMKTGACDERFTPLPRGEVPGTSGRRPEQHSAGRGEQAFQVIVDDGLSLLGRGLAA
jgi:hypothetical protein